MKNYVMDAMTKMKFVNPTGRGIRNDTKGEGRHGAPRGMSPDGFAYRSHDGVDFAAKPGQVILMPVSGAIPRESRPYYDDLRWHGILIINSRIEIKLWYFQPHESIIGRNLKAGTPIGYAQDIGEKYEGVTPHIHLRITKIDPMLLFKDATIMGTQSNLYEMKHIERRK